MTPSALSKVLCWKYFPGVSNASVLRCLLYEMHTARITLASLASGALVVSTVFAAAPSPKATAPISAFAAEVFVDYAVPSHAGPGPHPTTESADFQLTQGGIRWFAGDTVKYQITGSEPAGGNAAVEDAVATWDGFITTRAFTHDDASPSVNPCGGVNTVVWDAIDGSGGTLATASVCRNVATKEIAGFVVTMDSAETWATDGSAGSFDVENVTSHEFGHVAGLGHDNPPKSGCLAMYTFAGLGEIQKRTLGLGDKLGMDVLYGTGDTDAGPGCGS